jgi:hypothetical protein
VARRPIAGMMGTPVPLPHWKAETQVVSRHDSLSNLKEEKEEEKGEQEEQRKIETSKKDPWNFCLEVSCSLWLSLIKLRLMIFCLSSIRVDKSTWA